MQRMAWTDERLEERFDGIDGRCDEVDRRFDEVNRGLDGLAVELAELRHGMMGLQATLNRGSIGVILGLIGVIGAILASGG
jgi:hypothetical protein